MDSNSNNHLAPVIYVADSPEQAINYKWDSRANRLNRNVVVLEPHKIQELGEGNEHFFLPYDLTPGEVLIRHPYNQGYILATKAEGEYIAATAEGIFLIARCLGATKITYKKCDIKQFKREIDSHNSLKYKVVDLDVDVKKSKEEELKNKISMTREFPKDDKQGLTKEQFEKAKSIASERGLRMSQDIRSLLDARDPDLGAPMTRQTVNVEIFSSLNDALDIAFSLNTVPFFHLDSNTKIATETKTVLSIEWEIVF